MTRHTRQPVSRAAKSVRYWALAARSCAGPGSHAGGDWLIGASGRAAGGGVYWCRRSADGGDVKRLEAPLSVVKGSSVPVLLLGLSGVLQASVSLDVGATSEMEAQTPPPKRMLPDRVERAGRRERVARRRGAEESEVRRDVWSGV